MYRIFGLGVLPSDNASRAFGLNDVGAVVGQSDFEAFVWLFNPAYGFNRFAITQLATNNFAIRANDINNAGYAVGQGQQSSGVDPEAYGWRLDLGTVTASPFGIFDGGFSSEAFGINEASTPVVVGTSEGTHPTCGRQALPFKADFDTTPSLDLLGTTSQISARASGIDNSATPRIVGTSNTDPLSCTVLSVCSGGDGERRQTVARRRRRHAAGFQPAERLQPVA